MATSTSNGAGRKERITPPKPRLLSREAKKLRGGDPAAARILAEESVAVRQGVRKREAETLINSSNQKIIKNSDRFPLADKQRRSIS
jgi:hypothetical protein